MSQDAEKGNVLTRDGERVFIDGVEITGLVGCSIWETKVSGDVSPTNTDDPTTNVTLVFRPARIERR